MGYTQAAALLPVGKGMALCVCTEHEGLGLGLGIGTNESRLPRRQAAADGRRQEAMLLTRSGILGLPRAPAVLQVQLRSLAAGNAAMVAA